MSLIYITRCKCLVVKNISKITIIIVILIILIAPIVFLNIHENRPVMKVYFFGVGGGLSILIQTPDSKHILLDAGSFQSSTTENTSEFLNELGIFHLDAIIITHPHPDHISYIPEVLNHTSVDVIYAPTMRDVWSDTIASDVYDDYMIAINTKGCPIITNDSLIIGDFIQISDKIKIQIIGVNQSASEMNSGCLVTRMVYENVSFLFTGDANWFQEKEMVKTGTTLKSTVLQVGHHGINDSTTQEFVDAVRPEVAVISCGWGLGTPQEPQPGVIEHLEGSKIYLTMFRHWVVVETDGNYYRVIN